MLCNCRFVWVSHNIVKECTNTSLSVMQTFYFINVFSVKNEDYLWISIQIITAFKNMVGVARHYIYKIIADFLDKSIIYACKVLLVRSGRGKIYDGFSKVEASQLCSLS